MITFVLSFLSTFSSAEEKNSALSPSLMSPSTYRIVKLSRCFFSTIKGASGRMIPTRERPRVANRLPQQYGRLRPHSYRQTRKNSRERGRPGLRAHDSG